MSADLFILEDDLFILFANSKDNNKGAMINHYIINKFINNK
jgi:hypothetical protein